MTTSPADPDYQDDDEMDAAARKLDLALGEAIRILRLERRWSQDDLAYRSHISKRTIGRIERGESSLQMPQMFKIATALGLELPDIMQRASELQAKGFGG
ncbi:helix-turn-helix transcriptional regulator [Nocardia sp. CC227C]|uniref:helix-turn-helix transcriptional regulator n=1 Tax=Nocardia sp. CC227C TaxID=3044562 RepID=UPI00278C3A6A|nr:helix-turn-helix transcriptional regulator [Nocardia sp. CC227C]